MNGMEHPDESYWMMGAGAPFYRQPPPQPQPQPQPSQPSGQSMVIGGGGVGSSAPAVFDFFGPPPTATVHPEMLVMGLDLNSSVNHSAPSLASLPQSSVPQQQHQHQQHQQQQQQQQQLQQQLQQQQQQQSLLNMMSDPFGLNFVPYQTQPQTMPYAMGDWQDSYGLGNMIADDELYFGCCAQARDPANDIRMMGGSVVGGGTLCGPDIQLEPCPPTMMPAYMPHGQNYPHHNQLYQQHLNPMVGPDEFGGGSVFYGTRLLPDI